ncbi:beta strand repeat-containing protein [Limnobacter parvus]|uniref:Tail fiber domain-containing protein n=1 Tax=Limnobacter parvus TaxID=2939690 RepID=A0ABT1XFJ1_9BURK|nr:tail fiber domain-containing protein [Limnobacter parvus]MCR2745067.1 tail fiber domain-containing protein [Limnobacter parvus]
MKKNTQHSQHTGSFHERPLVTAVRHALPYVVGLSLALSISQPASSRSSDSAAAFTATQLVRQFTLKNTVTQVSLGMQGYVADVGGQQRGPAMGPRPTGFPADMGSVPNNVNLPQRDGAGRPLGYCAWDNESAVTSADYNAGQGVGNPLVYAVVSPGLNGAMQTTCAYILQNGVGVGDDHVQVTAPIQVSSKQYKTAVGTEADLLTTPGEEGDIRLVLDTNKLYSYVNGVWTGVQASPFSDNSAVNGTGAISYTGGTVTVADFQATTVAVTGAVSGASAVFTGDVAAATFTGNGAGLTDLNAANFSSGVISPEFGGTGVNGAAAANGTLLIGNGSGFTLGTLTAGAGISVLNDAGAITIGNAGVLSITGTADQIVASANNGDVVLSLPQAIGVTSTPTFGGMMLNGDLMGTAATFTGAVNVGSLTTLRLNVADPTGVTLPNMIIGTDAMVGVQSGAGANTAVGILALQDNTTGSENTALGRAALTRNTTGSFNTALGRNALNFNTTGSNNSAFGQNALPVNTTGTNNTAVGRFAGTSNTTGSNNSFIGIYADATTGALGYATAIGADSRVSTSNTIALGRVGDFTVIGATGTATSGILQNKRLQVTGDVGISGNLAIVGDFAANTFSGTSATFTGAVTADRINVSTSAGGVTYRNMIVGTGAMVGAQSGFGANTALGVNAMAANTTGAYNVAVGSAALQVNTNGFYNSALGTNSLYNNTSGDHNTAIGHAALYSNTTGYLNTATGFAALGDTTTGVQNTALGHSAGQTNTTGSNNLFLGFDADATSAALGYATAIGAGSRVATSNTIALGRNSNLDQVVIGTDTRNDTTANTKLYVNGDTRLNGTLYGTNATFSGAVTMNSLAVQRLDVSTSAGGVTNPNMIVGTGAMPLAQTGLGGNTALGISALAANTSGRYNTASGYQALAANTTGVGNVALGAFALDSNTTGERNVAIGRDTLSSITDSYYNIAVGSSALLNATDSYYNIAIGYRAFSGATNLGVSNLAIGNLAMFGSSATGDDNIALGDYAMYNGGSGSRNITIGASSSNFLTTGYQNTTLGTYSLSGTTSGYNNSVVGYNALLVNTTGFNNSALGANADVVSGNLSYATIIGSDARVATSNTIALGRNSALDQIVIGTDTRNDTFANTKLYVNGVTNLNGDLRGTNATFSGAVTMNSLAVQRLDVSTSAGGVTNPNMIVGTGAMPLAQTGFGGNTALGIQALAANTTGYHNTASGYQSLYSNTTGRQNTATGNSALYYNTTGVNNVAMGDSALYYNTTGSGNIATGNSALFRNSTGYSNIATGDAALFSNTTGFRNVATGYEASHDNTTGYNNTVVGYESYYSNTTGFNNTGLGYQTGNTNTTGSNNTFIGYDADATSAALTYATAIGATSRVATSNTIALGRNSNLDQIVIGTDTRNDTYAGTKLYVNGISNFNGAMYGTTATFSGAVTVGSLAAARLDVSTSAGGVTNPNMIVGTGAMPLAQSGSGRNTALGINTLASNTSGNSNTASGYGALAANTTGSSNTASGYNALDANTTGQQNTALGTSALGANITGWGNVALGRATLTGATDSFYNIAIGSLVMTSSTVGNYNIAMGWESMLFSGNGATDNVSIGALNMYSGDGSSNSLVGNYAMVNADLAYQNSGIGTDVLTGTRNGYNNSAVGYSALSNNLDGFNNSALGANADVVSGNLSYATIIGSDARVATSNTIALGRNSNVDQVVIGTDTRNNTTANTKLYVNGDTRLNGMLYGTNATFSGAVTMNSLAVQRLDVSTSAGGVSEPNMIAGAGAMPLAQSGFGANTALGINALAANISGGSNTANGIYSLYSNTTGNTNTASGSNSMYSNTTGDGNTATGYSSLYYNTTGRGNTASGWGSLSGNTTGNDNTALGRLTGTSNTTGSNNTFIGYYADATSGALTYAAAIGAQSTVATSNTIALGRNSNIDQVVIGTDTRNNTTANTKLYVNGDTRLNGTLYGTNATFSGAVTMNSLAVQRLDVSTSAGGVTMPNMIVGTGAMPLAQSGFGGNTAVGIGALAANTDSFYNTASGYRALYSNTTGDENTASGYRALYSNTTGRYNVANGSNALYYNTTGFDNMASGSYALFRNTTGYYNVASGNYSLSDNTTGYNNVASGTEALVVNTTGFDNTALGTRAGATNTTGSNNTFIGRDANATSAALTYATAFGSGSRVASSNTIALGRNSNLDQIVIGTATRNDTTANTKLYVNGDTRLNGMLYGTTADFSGAVTVGSLAAARLNVTTSVGVTTANMIVGTGAMVGVQSGAGGNTALGLSALAVNTTGSLNTATGYQALAANTTGGSNMAIGFGALRTNTSGSQNTASGYRSLYSNTTGYYNMASGWDALYSNTTGYSNTASGSGALYFNTTGINNTALGKDAGDSNATGSNNTFLGFDANAASGALTYASAIGAASRVATSNTIALGRNSNVDQIVIGTNTRNDTTANTKLYVNGDTRLNGTLYGTNAVFTGAVSMGAFAVERLDIATSAGGVLNDNVIIGMGAMVGAQSGTGGNTAVGMGSLASNTNGFYNTATGNFSLFSNTTGYKNTVAGDGVMYNNTTGYSNTAMGDAALLFNTVGYQNTAIGDAAMYANVSGNRNAVNGAGALSANTTGSNNIAFGYNSGNANTTGSNNTFLGNEANSTSGALTYATAIGSNSLVATSNTIALGRNSNVDQVVIGTNTRNNTTANTKLYVNGDTRLNGTLYGTTAVFTGAVSMGSFAVERLNISTSAGGVTDPNLIIGTGAMAGAQSGLGANTALGISALAANTTGYDNTATGNRTLFSNTTGSNNTATGAAAMYYNTSGGSNSAYGASALMRNTTGQQNTAIGNQSMGNNTIGNWNTAIGSQSLFSNTSGTGNAATSYGALNDNTTGSDNSASGSWALSSNTTGNDNTAFGNSSGGTNTTGSNNTFLGYYADATTGALTYATAIGSNSLVATSNTIALGRNSNADQVVIGTNTRNNTYANTKLYVNGISNFNGALYGTTANFSGAVTMGSLSLQRLDLSATAGVTNPNMIIGSGAMAGVQSGYGDNTAVGSQALAANTTGGANVATGGNALRSNTSGFENTANGYFAAVSNTTGSFNVAIGAYALYDNTTGSRNVATGFNALSNNVSGDGNVAYGREALFANTIGSDNAAFGRLSGNTITTGSNNSFFGYDADATSGALTYATAIGASSTVATSNTIALGRNSTVDQIVIGTATRNNTYANTKLYVNGISNFNGALYANTLFANGVEVKALTKPNIDAALTFASQSTVTAAPNLALGTNALGGTFKSGGNVAIGDGVLSQLDGTNPNQGERNTGVGRRALYANTTGYSNTALGFDALYSNTNAIQNVAVGTYAMDSNTTGSYNTAVGYRALEANINGYDNTAVGWGAMGDNTTGFDNTAVGDGVMGENTTGSGNVAIGEQAMMNNTTGSNNTALGAYTQYMSGNLQFATAIGSFSSVNTSNTVVLGRTTDTTVIGATGTNGRGSKLQVTGTIEANLPADGTALALVRDVYAPGGYVDITGAGYPGYTNSAPATIRFLDDNTQSSHIAFRTKNTGNLNNADAERMRLTSGGNLLLASASDDGSGNRLQVTGNAGVTGNVVLNTSGTGTTINSRIQFGAANEGSDPIFMGRINPSDNNSILQMTLGDDPGSAYGSNGDRFQIATTNNSVRHHFDSDGTAYHAGALNVPRINVSTSAGGVSIPNMIVGTGAMPGAQSGTGANTVLGIEALAANTTGSANTASGRRALFSNISGNNNSASGNQSLFFNTTGSGNTASGGLSMYFNTTGYSNTANGNVSLYTNTTGYENTAIGGGALFFNSTGFRNTALGDDAGTINTTGSNNTFIGYAADAIGAALTYATVIGADARVATSNTMVLGRSDGNHQVVIGGNSRNDDSPGNKLYVQGNIISHANQVVTGSTINSQGAYLQWNRDGGTGATYLINQKGLGPGGFSFGESTGANAYTQNMALTAGGNLSVVGSMTATAFNVSSDRRLKTNVSQLDTGNVLDKLEMLRTYSYDYIANRDLGRRIGVIAQELQPLFPEAVAVRSDGFMAVDYNALGAMAAVGVGQLSSKFKILDNRVTEQGTLITALDEKVSGVDIRVASLETWKTEAVGRMDGFQMAIDSNVKKIAENALAIQSNTTDIKRLDDVLVQLDGTVKGNTDSINSINTRWGNTFSASEDGSLLTVLATELKVSNFTAQKVRSNSVYTQRLEAEMAAIRELDVDSLKANTAVANSVQAKQVNTGAAQVYAGVGAPAFLFAAPSDGHYTVNTSAMDGSYATATVIVNAGQAKVVTIASEGIELMAVGNTVKANAAGKSIKASWIKTG